MASASYHYIHGEECKGLCSGRNCSNKNSDCCDFIQVYQKQLEKINFKELYSDMERLAITFKEKQQLKEEEESILVLIVYEAPSNKCSERQSLINYFNSKGIPCEELKYPIEENY